ncbi:MULTISPECIES: hypothetical protein [unclassified Sphingomonas]
MNELHRSVIQPPSYHDAPQAMFGLVVGLSVSIVIWMLIALALMLAYA